MNLLYIIEDEPIMAECIATGIQELAKADEWQINLYDNAISALNDLDRGLPDVILLDVLLGGPDAFTLLNELVSYSDTARIPAVLMTSLKLQQASLAHYGVTEVLDKAKMTPEDIYAAITRALEIGQRVEFQAQQLNPAAGELPHAE